MNKVNWGACALALVAFAAFAARDTSPWQERLKRDFARIDQSFEGEIGVYLRNASEGSEISYEGDKAWYLSSATVPLIAAAFYYKLERSPAPARDVASARLPEQLFHKFDRIAADRLIQKIGVPGFEKFLKAYLPTLSSITDFKHLLRGIYSELNVQSRGLNNKDLTELEAVPLEDRLDVLAKKLYVGRHSFRLNSLDEAFARYFEKGANSVSVKTLGDFMEALFNGRILSAQNTEALVTLVETSSLGKFSSYVLSPPNIRRSCSARRIGSSNSSQSYVMSVCAKGPGSAEDFEKLFSQIHSAAQTRLVDSDGSWTKQLFSLYR